jgi:hypothetical protein
VEGKPGLLLDYSHLLAPDALVHPPKGFITRKGFKPATYKGQREALTQGAPRGGAGGGGGVIA